MANHQQAFKTLLAGGAAATLAALTPEDEELIAVAAYTPTFTWTDTGATTYEIEIASDAAFSSVVDTDAAVATNSYTSGALDSTIPVFYWRVRTKTPTEGDWTATRTFSLWTVLDTFLTDRVAGAINTTTAEPVGGTRTVTDTGGDLTISSDQLVFDGTQSGLGDPFIVWPTFTRAGGVGVFYRVTFPANDNQAYFGLEFSGPGSTPADAYLRTNTAGTLLYGGGISYSISIPATYAAGVYDLAFVLGDSSQTALFMRAGAGAWRLAWVDDVRNSTPIRLHLAKHNGNDSGHTVQRAGMRYLAAPFATNYGYATLNDATLSSGDTFTGDADGFKRFDFTLNGSPSANDRGAVLEWRRQDADNMWRAMIVRNAGNTAWDFQVRTVSGGSESTPSGWTDVTGVSTPDGIAVLSDGSTQAFYTRAGSVWTKRGATLTVNYLPLETGMGITAVSPVALTRVLSFPLEDASYQSEFGRSFP